jgi:agmatine deiminase
MRLAAEWEVQDGVLVAWPHEGTDWAPELDRVEPVFVELIRAIAQREVALVIAHDRAAVRSRLAEEKVAMDRVRIHEVPTNDTWTRDYGPLTAMRETDRGHAPVLVDFRFNGWAGKFEAGLDDAATRALYGQGAFGATPLVSVDMVFEGGSIESDGQGTALVTSRCLLHRGRLGARLDRTDPPPRQWIEQMLHDNLGVERTVWIEHGGLEGDDTDGHIDTLARLTPGHGIVYVACDDPTDPHFADLQAMEVELRALRTLTGEPYTLYPLPWPSPKRDADGRRLPATYANFLIVNGAVLLPTYDDPADRRAIQVLGHAFPDRDIVPIPFLPIVEQGGSLHCLTMQLPKGVLP